MAIQSWKREKTEKETTPKKRIANTKKRFLAFEDTFLFTHVTRNFLKPVYHLWKSLAMNVDKTSVNLTRFCKIPNRKNPKKTKIKK